MKRRIIISTIIALVLAGILAGAFMFNLANNDVDRLFEAGQKFLEDGDYDEAIAKYKRILEIDDENVDALLGLATAYFEDEEYRKVERYVEDLLEIEEDNEEAIYLYAKALYEQEEYREAFDFLQLHIENLTKADVTDLYDELYVMLRPKKPVSSTQDGNYDDFVMVELLADNNENIYYTLDGEEPTEQSQKYMGGIRVSDSGTLKAVCVDEFGLVSVPSVYEFTINKVVNIDIKQVDTKSFPDVSVYAKVTDSEHKVVDNVLPDWFLLKETDSNNNVNTYSIKSISQVQKTNQVKMNLVLDISDSMHDSNKIGEVKTAASNFISQVEVSNGDEIELMSFNDSVYLIEEFSSDYQMLRNQVNYMTTSGGTALYDAIYAAITRTNTVDGAKCVIAFTDGKENSSSHSYQDVINLSRQTSIPVYLIGIGSGVDRQRLEQIASECSGGYFDADEVGLGNLLNEIYNQIYETIKDLYVITFETVDENNLTEYRTLELVSTNDEFVLDTQVNKEYIPEPVVYDTFMVGKDAYKLPRGHEDRLPIAISICINDGIPVDDLIYVRYMASDGDNAFVLASPVYNTQLIFQYAMRKNNGSWQVLERYNSNQSAWKELQKDLPTFNLKTLPQYDVSNYDTVIMNNAEQNALFTYIRNNFGVKSSNTINYLSRIDNTAFCILMDKTRVLVEYDDYGNIIRGQTLSKNLTFTDYHRLTWNGITHLFLQD